MIGQLMLLKMLHCKLNRKRSKRNNGTNVERIEEVNVTPIKKEINDSDEQGICRVCLKDGYIPIYGNQAAVDIPEAIYTFGGIEISSEDNYPKFLCQSCHNLLQGAILFRKTAQKSDETLRQPAYDDLLDNYENTDNNKDDSSDYEEKEIAIEKTYYCRKCNLTFRAFKEYSEHRLSQEHENKRQTCPVCNKTYATEYYKRHALLHKLERPFMCDICGKKFALQGQFGRHRTIHFSHLPFKCSLCPYKGRFKESLKMHMRTHTGEKPYQCTQCPSRFVSASNLNKHMFTHKGKHDFKCDSCGRGFYTKRDLGLHFKVDHAGIKEHICNICGKAFGYRKQMMKHQLKVHKREKLKSGRMPLYLQMENKEHESE